MQTNRTSPSGFYRSRVLVAFTLCSAGLLLTMLSFAATPLHGNAKAATTAALASAAAGSWSIVPSPNINPSGGNRLYAVACTSANDCWAVGNYYDNGTNTFIPLIEHYDGVAWSIMSSPSTNPVQNNGFLFAVACTGASNCWAVGYYAAQLADQSLIEHYDGTAWSIANSPNTSPVDFNLLNGVTCASSADCWATGDYYDPTIGTVHQTLIEHYDGTAWSIATSANSSSSQQNVLYGVTCLTTSDCWTIGSFAGTSSKPRPEQTLTEHYDGTAWSIVSSPNTSHSESNYSNLYSVTCGSAGDCWAAGNHYNCCDSSSSAFTETLVEHYTGGTWAIVNSPSPGTYANNLSLSQGVICASSTDCWAVGNYANDPSGPTFTLAEHYDGAGWSVVSSANVNASRNDVLFGVTCLGSGECWAVGYYNNGNCQGCVDQTLIEHYTVPPVHLNAVASQKTHGSAGTFDVDLPLNGSGIECRSGGANGDYTLIFTFANSLTSVGGAGVTSGTATVGSGNIDSSDSHQYVVNLTGVTNAQYVTVSLSNVTDSVGNFSSALSGSMAVLVGDTTADRSVNSADISQTKSQSGHAVTISNFREDVTADGSINSADISLVKSKSGTALP